VLWEIEPVFKDLEIKIKDEKHMALAYLAVNFVTVWMLARFAFFTGFGVSSYVYVAILVLIANFVQFAVWKGTEEK